MRLPRIGKKGGNEEMTYEEKVMEENPVINPDNLEDKYCPSEFGYSDCCGETTCNKCWNREMTDEGSHE